MRRNLQKLAAGVAIAIASTVTSAQPAGTLIILNKDEASASLLARATGEELARLDTGVGPHEVAVSPDGKTAIVADYGAQSHGSTLTVLDLESRTVTRTIDLIKYHRPHGIVFMPDGRHVVVTTEVEQVLLVVDIRKSQVVHAIDTRQEASHMVAITPDGTRAFVSNIASGSVTVIDLLKNELVKVIQVEPGAEGIDVSPDGKEVWVGNRAADSLSIIDTTTLEVVETIDCASFPIRIKFTPDGEHVLVSCARSGDVAVFNASSRTETRRIAMAEPGWEKDVPEGNDNIFRQGPVPIGILIPPDGGHAYIANTNANIITVINLKSWTIQGRYTAGLRPDGMGWSQIELGVEED